MPIFYFDSEVHYTTAAYGGLKIPRMDGAPEAGVGAFGAPGNGDDYHVNFANTSTLEISAYYKGANDFARLFNFVHADGPQLYATIHPDGSISFQNATDLSVKIAESPADTIRVNVQHHIYIKVVISDTVGKIDLKVDGIVKINSPATLDTKALAGSGISQINFVGINGKWSHRALANVAGDLTLQPRTQCRFADADGPDETMTQVGGTGGLAYTAINETAPNEATYLEGDTAGERNNFEFPDVMSSTATVFAVQAVALVWKTDADACEGRFYVTIGGNDYFSPSFGLPASPAYLRYIWTVNPATTNPWTPAELNAPLIVGWDVVT